MNRGTSAESPSASAHVELERAEAVNGALISDLISSSTGGRHSTAPGHLEPYLRDSSKLAPLPGSAIVFTSWSLQPLRFRLILRAAPKT
jgi:hypothetical protein